MAETSIEWTDRVWNPVAGCTPVSAGCANCYAARMAVRLQAMEKPGYTPRVIDTAGRDVTGLPGLQDYTDRTVRIVEVRGGRPVFTGDVRTLSERLGEPLKWRKPCRVFVNSMSDLFHEAVPFDFIDRVFAVMALCRQHTFQVLTKRPKRMAEYLASGDLTRDETTLPSRWMKAAYEMAENDRGGRSARPAYLGLHARYHRGRDGIWPLENVWLGTSVENQDAADERIPHLLKCPAAVWFLSCEPLLGRVDLWPEMFGLTGDTWCGPRIGWVIAGGESGPGARGCEIDDLRSLRDQCKAAGVPFFLKQLGARPFGDDGYFQLVRCHHCGTFGDVNAFDVAGADDGNVFCNQCNREIPCEWNLKDKKGGDPAEWPEDLRVREMPEVRR